MTATAHQEEGPAKAASTDAREVIDLFEAKATAEVDAAAAALAGGAFAVSGSPGVPVLLLKGIPGPADVAAGKALAGPDAAAAEKSLVALGLPSDTCAVITRGPEGPAPSALAMRALVAASDPVWVIALDRAAAKDAAAAAGVSGLTAGRVQHRHGRIWLAVDGLEASLTDPELKRRVWAQFKAIAVATESPTPARDGAMPESETPAEDGS